MKQMRGIAGAAFGVLLALTAGTPAWAQVPCSTVCSRYDQGQCVQYTHYDCGTPSTPAASYGAIAYGRTSQAFGYSHRWGSEAKAESVAMQNCGQHGDDCEIMVWFENKCGAVVSGGGATAFWGLGNSENEAQADAQKKCQDGGGSDCEVQVSHCSN
jgi:hypothetical protein